MQIAYDSKTGNVKFVASKDDLTDIFKLTEMTQSEGWKILEKYMKTARECIIESGKTGVFSRTKRDMSSDKFARLSAHDVCQNLVEDLKSQGKIILENIKQESTGGLHDGHE